MLNQSGNSGGFQFNNRNITIVVKTYPQSAKLNMTITYRDTYIYGLFNINPVAERHQWFSSDALIPVMHCFHAMELTESPFGGNVLHIIPSNDFSCGIQVMEVYNDYNHEFPTPKQISTIIQYPPYHVSTISCYGQTCGRSKSGKYVVFFHVTFNYCVRVAENGKHTE